MINALRHGWIAVILTLSTTIGVIAQVPEPQVSGENSEMTENEVIIREFIAAWSRLDAGELAGYFAEEGVYHNMPSGPVQGRGNIEQFIAGFIAPWQSTDWEIITLLADGDTVVVERLDKTVVAGSEVNLPCLGVFEMADGKIRAWRDYFDLTTYTDALTAALAER